MRAITKFGAAAAAFVAIAAFAAPSQATIYIGLQQAGVNGGALTTVATDTLTPGGAVFFGSYGTFEMELITGVEGVFPALLASTTSDHNQVGAGGTLDIFITRDDIDGPIPWVFKSVFTTNNVPAGWTITETSYVSAANVAYGGTELATHTFTATGVSINVTNFAGGGAAGPYALTSRYTLTAPTTGSVENTISIHAVVPETSTWALMIVGFGGAGAMLRSRRRAQGALA